MHKKENPGLFGIRPVLCVENVSRAIEYYVNKLEFNLGWAWDVNQQRFLEIGEKGNIGFALVGCNETIQLMLSEQSQGQPGMWIHLDVDSAANLNKLYEKWMRNGAKITEPPSVRPWGTYEMRVEDLDGHTFRVSSPPEKG